MKNIIKIFASVLATMLLVFSPLTMEASSHREAPLISNDPLADNVDLYAFRSPDNPDMITLIATYVPLQAPHGGPNYYNFGENIRYEIHVDNDATIPGDEIIYRFTFTQEHEDPTTFFYIRLGAQNSKMTYTLERSIDGGTSFQTIVTDGIVPPNNIGPRSIESAVGLNTDYSTLFNSGITMSSTGERIFAGPTDDPFFVDLGGIFDLGNSPRQVGRSIDALACMNVSALAIQVPISTLLKAGAPAVPTSILDGDYVIGVWASASRQAVKTLSSTNDPDYSGDWIQVSRLGMPLTNEAVIPVGQKDFWNSITPYAEITETTMDEYFYNPELALYMDDDQFGGAVPAFGALRIQTASLGAFDFTNGADGLFGLKGSDAVAGTALDDAIFGTLLLPAAAKPRSVDLWPIFHTGVPNFPPYQLATGKEGNPLAAGKPFINNFLPNGGDMLRLNMAVPATPRDDPNFSSLGLIQAAVLGLVAAPFNETTDLEFIPNMDGFPNGRRLEDDVTRIELQAVGGAVLAAIGLWYDDYDAMDPDASPVTTDLLNVITFTTGVESNDRPFTSGFPYLAMPASGTGDCSGMIYTAPTGTPVATQANFFVSSNTQGKVGVYDLLEDGSIDMTTFNGKAIDADGVHYDTENDLLFQVNRSNNVVDVYMDVVENVKNGLLPTYVGSSSSDFINARELSVAGSKLVVAQDANDANGNQNRFIIYDINGAGLTLNRIYDADIHLWGIHLDGNTMYAIEDNSANLVRYDNFFGRPAGAITADASIAIEGMIRTHGLTYNNTEDKMILTDVGEASSPTDGAFTVVNNFTGAAADNMISLSEQIRIEGAASLLGNPVDVAYDTIQNRVLIAERANEGGRVLIFDEPIASGDATPTYSERFTGASGIYLQGSTDEFVLAQLSDLFASSNNSSMVGYSSILEDQSLSIERFMGVALDADGVYYDDEMDVLYQLNRTENVINAYSAVKASIAAGTVPSVTATSTSDFTNGREIAVAGNRMVVAQDAAESNGNQNALVVYEFSPTAIELRAILQVDINLWGIHADVNTLYAIVDVSNQVAVFDLFFTQETGTIAPDRMITVTDLTRTHGITYDNASDLMLLTDIGAATNDADGAIVTIANWATASDDGTISVDEQVRIAGASTLLGNPVDIAYDAANDLITIAERANGGGRLLLFANPMASGEVAPLDNEDFEGASAVYQVGSTVNTDPILTEVIDINGVEASIDIYPNPTVDELNLRVLTEENLIDNAVIEIYSINGQMIKTQTVQGNNNRIDVSNLPAANYTIILKGDDFVYQTKFTKI